MLFKIVHWQRFILQFDTLFFKINRINTDHTIIWMYVHCHLNIFERAKQIYKKRHSKIDFVISQRK